MTVSTVGVIKNMYRLSEDLPLVNLALSLHAPNQTLRQKIIPTAGGSPIDALMKAIGNHIDKNCRKKSHEPKSIEPEIDDTKKLSIYSNSHSSSNNNLANDDEYDDTKEFLDSNGKRPNKSKFGYHGVMIEYILLAGLNDQEEHARELGALLVPFGDYVLLNLIPYNPTDVRETFVAPTREAVGTFRRICQSEPYLIHTRIRVEMGQDIAGACGQLVLKTTKEIEKSKKVGHGHNHDEDVEIEDMVKNKLKLSSSSHTPSVSKHNNNKSEKSNDDDDDLKSIRGGHSAVLVSFTVAVALIGSFLLLRRLKSS